MEQIHLTWDQALAVIGGVVWFIRLEGKQSNNSDIAKARLDGLEERVKTLTDKHENLERRVADEIAAMRELLAEMRSDVKSILKQGKHA